MHSRPIRLKERKRALTVWYKSQELTYACTRGFSLKKVHSLAISHTSSSDKKILKGKMNAKQHINEQGYIDNLNHEQIHKI